LIILQLQARPRDLPDPKLPAGAQGTHITDYGLKAFAIAYNAAIKHHSGPEFKIDAYSNIYFELLQKLDVASKVQGRGKSVNVRTPEGASLTVQSPDLLLIDIHPNDASKTSIAMNDVAKVIEDALKVRGMEPPPERRCTVIVDITLNHIAEAEVSDVKAKV